jgi:UDP-N-acetylmuramoyl-tripeptide--D-alanyl-D-alanine ligase
MAVRTPARVLLYGTGRECDVRGADVEVVGMEAIRFTLHYRGRSEPVEVKLPGRHNLYNSLAAAAVAITEGLTLADAASLLRSARPETRLRLLPGPNGSTLLDDTYNASPDSMLAALEVLAQAPGRKIAVLGDMLELGMEEQPGHQAVGRRAAGVVEWLITVGPRGRIIAQAAREAGLRRVDACETRDEAEGLLHNQIQHGDHVLFKASQGMALGALVARLKAG